jgi:hypothetical protein
MKRSTVFAAVSLSLFAASAWAQTPTTTSPDQKPPTINQRLENQRDREQAGVKDDQLTKGEATHLRADDAAIRVQEKVYRNANDGKLTKGERKQLNKELNRSSNQIYRDRHNNRKPKS